MKRYMRFIDINGVFFMDEKRYMAKGIRYCFAYIYINENGNFCGIEVMPHLSLKPLMVLKSCGANTEEIEKALTVLPSSVVLLPLLPGSGDACFVFPLKISREEGTR